MFGIFSSQADGSLQPFRYELSPSSRINSFEPKALEDPATGRASQIGAVMMSSFQDYGIYTGKMFRLAWEATRRKPSEDAAVWTLG